MVEELSAFISENVKASGRSGAVLGVSGGVDSAVCLYLAVKALGPLCVKAFFMPHLSSQLDCEGAVIDLCESAGVIPSTVNISRIVDMFKQDTGCTDPVHAGNFAARIRSAYLYQYAASGSMLVINTSNKTERLMGYFTKWGDQAGDIGPLCGLYKTEVIELAKVLDLPEKILEAEPSAGFFEGQTDEKELGISYSELDDILRKLENGDDDQVPQERLEYVAGFIKRSEHKRNLVVIPGSFHG